MPLTYAMAALSVWCFMLGRIGLHRQVTSSDPAGNGMATALSKASPSSDWN